MEHGFPLAHISHFSPFLHMGQSLPFSHLTHISPCAGIAANEADGFMLSNKNAVTNIPNSVLISPLPVVKILMPETKRPGHRVYKRL
jgi:hypothetical protein